MPRVGFEPTISADERPKTYALDRAATGTGPPVSLVIFITLKYSLTSEDMQRRASCSDARKPSSLCTWYEVYPCICCTVKLGASVRFIGDFNGLWRYCGLPLTVPANCPFFSLIFLRKPLLSAFCYTYFAIYFSFVV